MKLFLWKNNSSESDFTDETNINMPNSSNAHSGGIVVLAETKEEAIKLSEKYRTDYKGNIESISCYDEFESKDEVSSEPVEINLDSKGVVIYCSGDC